MFLGEFVHTIDAKKRIAIPTRLRKELGETIVMTQGPDRCLFLYPMRIWEGIAEKLSKLPVGQADTRNFVRFMLAGAAEGSLDGLGRILIPDNLKQFADLGSKAVIIGVFDRIELWSPERWEEIRTKTHDNADRLAERLGELGAY